MTATKRYQIERHMQLSTTARALHEKLDAQRQRCTVEHASNWYIVRYEHERRDWVVVSQTNDNAIATALVAEEIAAGRRVRVMAAAAFCTFMCGGNR
jgi:hypothetical protein